MYHTSIVVCNYPFLLDWSYQRREKKMCIDCIIDDARSYELHMRQCFDTACTMCLEMVRDIRENPSLFLNMDIPPHKREQFRF